MTLLIKNCKLLKNKKQVVKNILIENGKIKSITSKIPSAKKVLDAKGQFAIPGLIDVHVHFREPGFKYKETWLTGSQAAAAGGVTTVLDMPNTKPPTFTKKRLDEKRKLAKKSIVNYGFHFGTQGDNAKEIKKVNGQVASTKLYMNLTTGKLIVEDKNAWLRSFQAAKRMTTHSEGPTALEAIKLSKQTKTPLHIAHVGLKEELTYIKKYKSSKLTCEVAPQHLFLDKSAVKKMGAYAMMKPNLKSKDNVTALWKGIKNGLIDVIATDHAPHTHKDKTSKNAPPGVPGLETMLPLLLDAMNRGKITLTKIVELTSKNPAKIFGIKNKGKLAVGYDADITLIDPKITKIVRNKDLFTKCGWSPFNGWPLKGWPTTTIVNGNIVFQNGKIYKNKGTEVKYV